MRKKETRDIKSKYVNVWIRAVLMYESESWSLKTEMSKMFVRDRERHGVKVIEFDTAW